MLSMVYLIRTRFILTKNRPSIIAKTKIIIDIELFAVSDRESHSADLSASTVGECQIREFFRLRDNRYDRCFGQI